MNLVVQKFGGTSVKDAQRVFNVAKIVTDTYQKGNNVVVVVSAQGDTTDDLIAKAGEINPNPSKREMDVLLSTGEQISMSLLAMAIERMGFPVKSLTGWQAGFLTDSTHGSSRIRRINKERIDNELSKRNIVIVAGFQGINRYDDITTLGRGGFARSILMWTAFIPQTRGWCRARTRWMRSPMTRCLSLPRSARVCYITARSRWRRSTASIWRCFRA